MSTINKKPFIKTLIEDMTAGQIATLQQLVDGGGNQDALLRTMNIKPVGNRTHITVGDKGVHLCDLEINFSLFKGYLIYTDHYCVLIHFTDSQVLGMFDIDLDDLTKFATISEELSVLELRNELNDTMESEKADIVETVNEGIADGDIVVPTYKTFPSTWDVTGTTKAFCDDVAADPSAVEGMAYLGEVFFSDMPGLLGNAELVVEVKSGASGEAASLKILTLTLTSGNVAPYHWEYTYWNGGSNVSGWVEIGGGIEVIELNSTIGDSGILSSEQLDTVLNKNNWCIKYGVLYFRKDTETSSQITCTHIEQLISDGQNNSYINFSLFLIVIDKSSGGWNYIVRQEQVSANPTLDGTESELVGETIGSINYVVGKSIAYLTTAPVSANTSGRLQIVVLSAEPATRYDGYLYIITA